MVAAAAPAALFLMTLAFCSCSISGLSHVKNDTSINGTALYCQYEDIYNENDDAPFTNFTINLFGAFQSRDIYNESGNATYFNSKQGDIRDPQNQTAYFFYLCKPDIPGPACNACIAATFGKAQEECYPGYFWEATVWFEDCTLHMSNRSFDISTDLEYINTVPSLASATIYFPKGSLSQSIKNMTEVAAKHASRYAAMQMHLSNSTLVQVRAQCVPELSTSDCLGCMHNLTPMMPQSEESTDLLGVKVVGTYCHLGYMFDSFGVSELHPRGKGITTVWIVVMASTAIGVCTLLFACFFTLYKWRTTSVEQASRGHRLSYDFPDMNFNETHDFQQFTFDELSEATEQFSSKNKLGEGGYGPVYKGVLVDNIEVAVKRLSNESAQGVEEFRNEVELIAQLQHRNLVKLLGCCLEKDENLLVYEYLPNRSLDFFIFDSKNSSTRVQLNWQMRLNIINGIAKGLMYLHEDSRLNVVHRDLKAANVLLDANMNPKISDFGLARIFGRTTDEANRTTPAGTAGYMAPEYIKEGSYSDKSDVFSFGVVLLEIISGKENRNFHKSKQDKSLISYAWKLWSEGRGRELIDTYVLESVKEEGEVEIMRSIQIGLLCVQDDWEIRPSMSSILFMLGSNTMSLSQPARPTESIGNTTPMRFVSQKDSSYCSNGLTNTVLSPR